MKDYRKMVGPLDTLLTSTLNGASRPGCFTIWEKKNPYYSLSGRLMGPRTGPEKGSLAIAGNWNIFPRSSSPCSSLYRLRYSVSRTDWKYAMNTRDRQKHSTVTRHSLFCRDELWRRHQSQLWILGGGFTVKGSISPDLCPSARAFATRICGLRSTLAVWKCGRATVPNHINNIQIRCQHVRSHSQQGWF